MLDGHRIARRSAAGGTFNVRSARAHSTTLQPELGGYDFVVFHRDTHLYPYHIILFDGMQWEFEKNLKNF